MKKLGLFAVVTALACVAVPAQAAPIIDFNGTSGAFSNTNIGSGDFNDLYTFNVADLGIVSGTITSIAVSMITDINFTSVSLNGIEFTNQSSGTAEFRSIQNVPVTAGPQQLRVRGNSGGNGAYAGTLAFVARPVPEPAGWTTMVLALGLLGGALKLSRRKPAIAATA
jgi:hypothetical protein